MKPSPAAKQHRKCLWEFGINLIIIWQGRSNVERTKFRPEFESLPFTTHVTLNKSLNLCSQMGISQMDVIILTWLWG